MLNYVALNGTNPAGTVDADSKLAKTLFAHLNTAAKRRGNTIELPTDVLNFTGKIEKTIIGLPMTVNWKEFFTKEEKSANDFTQAQKDEILK